ncbi:hypothetical protein Taro_055289 [Colocasia esculenta]|uniref:Uncharacterized protein n=1 Tax=Colocasia esculenta TaxID=4460 RepID=A0A843XR14_COLES|nr:hypothetical protein [Colocasia esculenta]
MLMTSAVQTRSGFSPALISGVSRWNSRSSRWPCYAQVQRSNVIQGKSELLIAVWIISIPKGVMGVGYNRLVDYVGIHDQRRLTEALC